MQEDDAHCQQTLAEGELDIHVSDRARIDELGTMARSLEVFRTNLIAKKRLERDDARKERRIDEERAEAEKLEILLRNEQEKIQLQRKFVAMVSHEFRTPLAIIDGQAKSIVKRVDRLAPDAIIAKLA